MDGLFGGLLAVGALVKHLIPTKKVNRFIPLINFGVATGVRIAQGNDIGQAAMMGAQDALMATGTHKAAQQVPKLEKI